jgi:glycosyltransferase involved in cell wall biosynthesis
LENGGGIGRQMGYFLGSPGADRDRVSYRLIDTRGPWFLGASPLHIGFAALYLLRALLQLAKASASSRANLVHANITGRGSTARKLILLTAARCFGLRYLLHVHDCDYAEEYRRRGAIVKALIAAMFCRAETVLVLGSRDRDQLSQLLQLPPGRIAVLPNAVPDPSTDALRPSCPDQPCHLLFLGYLGTRKGVPELLRALSRPEVVSRQWRVTLAGNGAVDEFRRLAVELGIGDRAEFPGWVDEAGVRTLCRDADVLVLPSHAEGLAMSVLEGMAHGLAVITTPVGAHLEVIEPEVSGLLVPPGDVGALALALVRVIDGKDLRRQLGAAARQRYLEKFEVRAYAARLSQLHAGLLRDPQSVAGIVNPRTTP